MIFLKQWLIDLRGKRSPIELAKKIGIAYPSYWEIEHRNTIPRLSIAKKIADELGFDWNLFFTEGLSYKKDKNSMQNEYEIRGDITIIFAYHKGDRYEIIIDTEDLDRVKCYLNTWHIFKTRKVPRPYPIGYTYVGGTKQFKLYHLIMGTPLQGYVVDHINHDTLDNRKSNLRIITRDQNQQNRSGAAKHNSVGIRGVTIHKKSGKYRARIKGKHLGLFENKEDAEKAVRTAIENHMPYAT